MIKKISMNMPEDLYNDLYKLYQETAQTKKYCLSYSFSAFLNELFVNAIVENEMLNQKGHDPRGVQQ